MIRIEYHLHPNDLQLDLSPDSVMFVNVDPVASSVAQVLPTDFAGMNQEAEIDIYQAIVQKGKAQDPGCHHP
jgi:hypothetical protein